MEMTKKKVKSKHLKKEGRRRSRYVQITETGAKALDQAVDCSAILVWFEILYRVWKTGKMTIELGNKTLSGMGVSRVGKVSDFKPLGRSWTDSRRTATTTITTDHTA